MGYFFSQVISHCNHIITASCIILAVTVLDFFHAGAARIMELSCVGIQHIGLPLWLAFSRCRGCTCNCCWRFSGSRGRRCFSCNSSIQLTVTSCIVDGNARLDIVSVYAEKDLIM